VLSIGASRVRKFGKMWHHSYKKNGADLFLKAMPVAIQIQTISIKKSRKMLKLLNYLYGFKKLT
jgi:hypothetical protein